MKRPARVAGGRADEGGELGRPRAHGEASGGETRPSGNVRGGPGALVATRPPETYSPSARTGRRGGGSGGMAGMVRSAGCDAFADVAGDSLEPADGALVVDKEPGSVVWPAQWLRSPDR